jgi:hypothetical protein
MKKFIVNVVEQKITPFVVEANDEWSAMEKASNGEGYIHESGSVSVMVDSTTWDVEDYTSSYPTFAYELIQEYL